MGKVVPPYILANGDDADADQVQANFNAFAAEVNGNLAAGLNVRVASAQTITGTQNAEGSSASLARADHAHTVQGLEALSSDPTTDLFVGREYFNTTSKQTRLCILTSPATWVVTGNPSASDLVTHGASHASGGSDALPNLAITGNMLTRTATTIQIKADPIALSADTWIDVTDDFTVATVPNAQQNVLFSVSMKMINTGAANQWVGFRLRDKTSTATNAKVWPVKSIGSTTGSNYQDIFASSFNWPAPATTDGNHTLSVQAWCDSNTVNLNKLLSYGSGSQAVTGIASYLQWTVG